MLIFVLVVLILLAAVAGGLMLLSARQKRVTADANQVVPGTPTRAPASWAGSHDPEPRLHRRLRDAMTALRTANSLDDGTTIVLRAELEQAALAWDDRLVAIAALPAAARDDQRATATKGVETIESAVAQYVSAATQRTAADVTAGLTAARAQLDLEAEIRKSLEAS
ncbi:hypothetical protein [Nocardia seriolae]|uniref:Uncharacterized protein n=1 Tax=Nocardia seriolae TaxID=37332 RepID=A0A0B8MZQ2_9NOCA|nr:hypothetical protein [Nocardia seriolae]APA99226.1 hypothetical protein NS506_05180 [Nocardia seriolae]MTJ63374.1 hypothetical protein [Nocardia seriolae]MTJ70224.1 hypothetical protein [Nocardia seriolae]MTJ88823.1 hypothetical protein [Nocardia seriolae]MTK32805.1 hypothetical protein [Nocardia seriolae]